MSTKETPVVSVIMPTYERPELLTEALRSVLEQTYTDFVVLVGDNSRSDDSKAVVDSFDDKRVLYHKNTPSLTAQENWVDLVHRVETPLVATLHDDDSWDPSYLATVVPPMLADESIAMTFNDFWFMGPDGRRLVDLTEKESIRTHRDRLAPGRFEYSRSEGLRLVAVWNAPQPAYAAIARTADVAACEFPDSIAPLYDIWLTYQLVAQGKALRFEPKRLTWYRVHSFSASSSGFAEAEDQVFRRILVDNEDEPDSEGVVTEIAEYWSLIRWARATRLLMSEGKRNESQREFSLAAPHLYKVKRLIAVVASRSAVAWRVFQLAWRYRDSRKSGIGSTSI